MKKITFLFCLILMTVVTYSQKETSAETKTEQQQNKELKKAEKEAAIKRVEGMIISRQFIFEISSMNDQARNLLNTAWIELSSSLNYIAINSNKLVLQLETNSYQTSNWPFDNSPANGTISKYDVQELKGSNEGYLIKFHTEGRVGTYDVTLNVSVNGKADLKMVSNNGIYLNIKGLLIPLGQSRINPIFI